MLMCLGQTASDIRGAVRILRLRVKPGLYSFQPHLQHTSSIKLHGMRREPNDIKWKGSELISITALSGGAIGSGKGWSRMKVRRRVGQKIRAITGRALRHANAE